MKFDTLNDMIPYVMGGKQKILTMHPYNAITLAMPGRHAKDTTPLGGDFVVMVDDEAKDWTRHQFTHTDLFLDLESKTDTDRELTHNLMENYLSVIQGASPNIGYWNEVPPNMLGLQDMAWENTLHPQTFLYAVQCLAVAEHRRYSQHEAKWGGRYLPFRFGAGIVEGLWTATDAAEKQRRGRPGVEWLEKDHGMPWLTKDLIE